jgi:hypothetical protein
MARKSKGCSPIRWLSSRTESPSDSQYSRRTHRCISAKFSVAVAALIRSQLSPRKGYAILRRTRAAPQAMALNFARAKFKDWGGADYQDLMAAWTK